MRAALLRGSNYIAPPGRPPTLIAYIRDLVVRHPDRLYIEIDRRGRCRERTLRSLFADACGIAHRLQPRLASLPAERCILCYQSAFDFIAAAWAAMLVGAHCVFWPNPASFTRSDRFVQRTRAAVEQIPGSLLMTDAAVGRLMASPRPAFPGERLLVTSEIGSAASVAEYQANDFSSPPSEIMISTSGTTGPAKWAVLKNDSILNRFYKCADSAPGRRLDDAPFQSIAGVALILPDNPTVYVNPRRLLSHPLEFFLIIERYRIQSFGLWGSMAAWLGKALRQSSRRYELSSVKRLGFGGEAIQAGVIEDFVAGLRRHGMGSVSVALNYAMTETGPICRVQVPDADLAQLARDGNDCFGIGNCQPGWSLRIADDRDAVVAEGIDGRIQVRSPAKLFAGYLSRGEYRSPPLTEDGWFDTGDLGRIEQDRLFVRGRQKLMLNCHARKIPFEHIEAALRLAEMPAGLMFAAALRDAGDAEDQLVVFVAPDVEISNPQALAAAITAIVAAETGVAVRHVVAVDPADIQRTATLKLDRLAMVDRYRQGAWPNLLRERMPVEGRSAAQLQRELQSLWRESLSLGERPALDSHYFELGGDSFTLFSLLAKAEERYGLTISLDAFYRHPTISGMASLIESARCEGDA